MFKLISFLLLSLITSLSFGMDGESLQSLFRPSFLNNLVPIKESFMGDVLSDWNQMLKITKGQTAVLDENIARNREVLSNLENILENFTGDSSGSDSDSDLDSERIKHYRHRNCVSYRNYGDSSGSDETSFSSSDESDSLFGQDETSSSSLDESDLDSEQIEHYRHRNRVSYRNYNEGDYSYEDYSPSYVRRLAAIAACLGGVVSLCSAYKDMKKYYEELDVKEEYFHKRRAFIKMLFGLGLIGCGVCFYR